MGGVLATLDKNNKVITMKDSMNPNIDYSKIIDLYNNNGFIKYNIDINLLKNYLKNLWNKTNLESLIQENQPPSEPPSEPSSKLFGPSNIMLMQFKEIVNEPEIPNISRSKLNIISMPLLLGSNTGLYCMLQQESSSITILLPNIIFLKEFNTYFNTYTDSIINKINNASKQENNIFLVNLLTSINEKTNYNLVNNQIRLLNIINFIFKLAILSQLIGYINNTTIKQNIIKVFIDEVSDIINMIPSDKCYLNSGIINTEPNICTTTEVSKPTTEVSKPTTEVVTTTTTHFSFFNPFTISYICSCCCCIIFILMIIKLLSPTPALKEE